MIAQLQPQTLDSQLSPEEYLAWEAEQESKHEYENGRIVAMTGGTVPHSQVAANLSALLVPRFRGKGCKVAVSDAKVMIGSGKYYYPDVVVSCDERDRNARDYLEYPCLIAEVISPTTESRDRGNKQQNYMRIPTLDAYLLVDSQRFQVELYERQEGSWKYVLIDSPDLRNEDTVVQIDHLKMEFSLAMLYENIDLDPQEMNSRF